MEQNDKYITSKKIRETFQVSNSSLKRWHGEGKIQAIKTVGNHRLYSQSSINKFFGVQEEKERKYICYARVSSSKQRGDLERQVQDLEEEYPDHEIIQDVGSGINWKRKGFTKMVEQVLNGDIEEIVVTNKDRLCRIGFELVEQICKRFNTKIVVLSKSNKEEDKDLAEDLLSIVTIFTARHHRRRGAEKKRKRKAKEKETKVKKRKEATSE